MDCSGYFSKVVEEVKNTEYNLQNVEKQRSVLTLDSQDSGGNLFYYAVGRRGDYLIYLRVGAIELDTYSISYQQCLQSRVFDSNCYNNKIVTESNKAALFEEVKKALELIKFD